MRSSEVQRGQVDEEAAETRYKELGKPRLGPPVLEHEEPQIKSGRRAPPTTANSWPGSPTLSKTRARLPRAAMKRAD